MNAKLKSLIFTSLSHFSVDGNFLLFPVLITYYIEIQGLSLVIIGLMPVLYNLISGFMGVVIGRYADRVDRDAMLLGGALVMNGLSVLLFIVPFILVNQAYLFMIIGSVILGISQSIYHPIGATVLSYTFGQKESASYLGINGSFGSLGRSVFPLILVFLAAIVGIKLGLIAFVVYFLIISAVVYLGLKFFKREKYRPRILSGESKIASPQSQRGMTSVIGLLVVIVFLRSMFVSISTTYIPTYLDGVFRSKELMGIIISVAFFSAVIGQPFFGYLTSRYGGKFTISLTSVGLIGFFLLFLFLSRSFASVLVNFTFFALFTYTGFPVLLGYVSQIVPKENLSSASSLVWGIGNTVGGSVGLLAFDGLLVIRNMFDSFLIMLAFAVVSTFLLVFLPKKVQDT
jgi:FSR family fosmidomycin resistance protein-like MFS transporter